MFEEYVRFVDMVKPSALLFENVPGFNMRFGGESGDGKSYSMLLGSKLRGIGFEQPDIRSIDFSDFGVPQSR
jgi:DNA (cytosine-5)-methyltransferase 1